MSRAPFALCCFVTVALVLLANVTIAGVPSAAVSARAPFDCFAMNCGMPEHGAFPHIVAGPIVAVANASQASMLFEGMRKRGHWSELPATAELFWKYLQPVAIEAGHGIVIITLTSQGEMHAVPLHVGDFVRYSPHRGKYETPPADRVTAGYWAVDGCIAVLCVAGDKSCVRRYARGLFRVTDGAQLSPRTFAPLRHGVVIDTQSMLPRDGSRVN